ncbi:hypothetical protein ACLB2K_016365 [Fragaria x ananassa]
MDSSSENSPPKPETPLPKPETPLPKLEPPLPKPETPLTITNGANNNELVPHRMIPENSSLAVSNFLSIKLDRTNYPLWLAQIQSLLKSQNLMSYVDGTLGCPPLFQNRC